MLIFIYFSILLLFSSKDSKYYLVVPFSLTGSLILRSYVASHYPLSLLTLAHPLPSLRYFLLCFYILTIPTGRSTAVLKGNA